MKKKIIILLFAAFFSGAGYAQKEDAILGKWLKTPKNELVIEVYKSGNKYNGKISWAKNNDERKPVGFIILTNLEYNPKKSIWENGKIKDPNSTRTYNAILKLTSHNTLEVHGYMGMKFLGSKKYFKRTQ